MSTAGDELGKPGLRRSAARRFLVHSGAWLSLIIVCLALWVVYRTLQGIELADVLAHLASLPLSALLLAFLVTLASYWVVTGYDVLALRHISRPLPYARAAMAGFLASVVGANLGFAMVTGGAVRYRVYSQAGLSALEIAAVTTMFTVTATLGVGTLVTLSMLFGTGEAADQSLYVPRELRRTLAALLLGATGLYIAVAAVRPITLRTSTWSVRLPSAGTTAAQIALGTVDLALVGSIIYVLLPASAYPNFFGYLGVFATALLAGAVSHVPGGIGVFESVMLLGLPEVPPAALLGAILLFRCIYYLAPLALAAGVLALDEAMRQRARLVRARGTAAGWLAEIGPYLMALLLVFAGAMLLFSGAVPTPQERLSRLMGLVPLPLLDLAHMLVGAAGLGLLLVARGISQRLARAYRTGLWLLGIGSGALLLKGIIYEGALVLAVVSILLWTTRQEYPRAGSLAEQGYPAEWLSFLAAILAVSIWLGLFSFKGIDYNAELWWRFHYFAEYPRFLRTTALVFVLAGGIALAYRLRFDAVPDRPLAVALEPIRRIVRADPNTRASLALLGDKRFLVSDSGRAFIMYRVRGKSWVALGDPVGPRDQHPSLVGTFCEVCYRYGGWPVFYLVDGEGLPLYADLGLTILKVGADARVPLAQFSLEGAGRAELRKTHGQVLEQGVSLSIVPSAGVRALMAELKEVSEDWQAHSGTPERGFSQGRFSPDYIAHFPCAVVRQGGRAIAFATLWVGADQEELAVDLVRYRSEAPIGTLEFMVLELMLGARARGYRWFNLGLVPLADAKSNALAPLWQRIGGMLYRQSEYLRGSERQRRFAEQLGPIRRPKYLASPGGMRLARILRDIAGLSGSAPV